MSETDPPDYESLSGMHDNVTDFSEAPYKDADTAIYVREINDLNANIDDLTEKLADTKERLEQALNDVKEAKASVRSDKRNDTDSDNNGGSGVDNVVTAEIDVFEATFYTAFCDTGCTGVTASGVDVSNTIYHEGRRIVAVDPSVIKLGTVVKVTLADGTSFEATAADTGGDIKGNRIDVLVADKEEARRLGRQDVKVAIME